MGKKITNIEFIERLKESRPNLIPLEEYKGYNSKIKFKCNNCGHVFYSKPSILLYRHANLCEKCSSWKGQTDNRKETFLIKLDSFNNNVRVIGNYINMNTEIECECKIHNIKYFSKPNYLLKHNCCPLCKKENKSNIFRKLPYNKNNFEEIINKYKNENLTILGKYIDDKTRIKCKCNLCNGIIYKMPRNIYDGSLHRTCELSNGEVKISEILTKKNIEFVNQKMFDDLLGCGNGLLSYDFYLTDYNLLIEYQGEQHESPIHYFGGEEKFKIQQEHDKRKRDYAKEHNIELLEIWYYDFDNIEEILLNKLKKISECAYNLSACRI